MDPDERALKSLRESPELFITDVLGSNTMEPYQAMICENVAKHSRVAVSACHAVGKTWLLARIVLWFLYNYRGAKVITTAPTNLQVEQLLWGEIHDAVNKSKHTLGGHLTSKKLELERGNWFALGFSPEKKAASDSGEQAGSNFQGFHANYILVVFDEAVGIPPDIWKQVEGLLTSGAIVKFVCIANPTTKNCDFFKCFSNAAWKKIHLSCFDSPNLKANNINNLEDIEREVDRLREMPDEKRLEELEKYVMPVTHLINARYVIEKALEWGVDSPLFQSKVLGQFPDVDDSSMVQLGDVKAAQARTHGFDLGWNEIKKTGKKDLRVVAVDVARFGEDLSVFTELYGTVQTNKISFAKRDLMYLCGKLTRFLLDDDDGRLTNVPIDSTGLGAGVFDRMIELQKVEKKIPRNFRFVEVHFGASIEQMYVWRYGKNKAKWSAKVKKEFKSDQMTYGNLKSKMFMELGQDLKNELRLLDEKNYRDELPTIQYTFSSDGKMLVEKKSDYKKRTGLKSPDDSDSLAIANLGRKIRPAIDSLKGLIKR